MAFLFVILSLFLGLSSQAVTLTNNSSSYIVYDIDSHSTIEGSGIDARSLVASTTKILTAVVALEEYDILSILEVKTEDTIIEGSKVYIQAGERITVLDAVYGLMLRSGNDLANLLARSHPKGYDYFINRMNDVCKRVGMKNSLFKNPSGLDSIDENISTAYDMAILMEYALKNEYFKAISSAHSYKATTLDGKVYSWQNKDKSVLYDERFICGKTGYTKKSGRILVNYAEAYSRRVVIVTINDSNDWANHKAYLNRLSKYVEYKLIKKGIYKIAEEKYIIEVPSDIKIPMLKSNRDSYNLVLYIGNKCYLYVYLNDLFISRYEVKLVNIGGNNEAI